MMLTKKLAIYLFNIAKLVSNGTYVNAPMFCPECGQDAEYIKDDSAHIVFSQKEEGVELYYIAVACEGYWGVDPQAVGLPRGNWSRSRDPKDPS